MQNRRPWPTLALNEWQPTLTTLHMAAQVVGKVRLAAMPMINATCTARDD